MDVGSIPARGNVAGVLKGMVHLLYSLCLGIIPGFIYSFIVIIMAKVEKKQKVDVAFFKRHDKDTWSPEYQIYLLTKRIECLQSHLTSNHKDFDAKRRLLKLVGDRRQHLKYLKNKDLERYADIAKKTWLKV